jgi:hypothetical protein
MTATRTRSQRQRSTEDEDESDQEEDEDEWRRTGTQEEMLTVYIHKFIIARHVIECIEAYKEAHENNSS